MGVTPQYVGSYGRAWLINLANDSGTDNLIGISTSSIAVVLRNLNVNPPTDTTSTGTVTITSVAPGQIVWQPTANDFAAPGSFELEVTVTGASGPVTYDPYTFTINQR